MSFWKHFHHPLAAMVLLRVTLAVLLLFHGWAKITGGIAGIEALVVKAGLPAFLAYGVFIGEVIALSHTWSDDHRRTLARAVLGKRGFALF